MKYTNHLLLFYAACMLIACERPSPTVFVSEDKKAIHGYDPVAYFTLGKPVEGKDSFMLEWNDANWYFSSEANMTAFMNAPDNYAPQYGGYCAYGMSNGYKASTEPDAWSIVDGKLYLNYNTDVRKDWLTTKEDRIRKADANWPEVMSQ